MAAKSEALNMSKPPAKANGKGNTPRSRRKPTKSRYDVMTILRLCRRGADHWDITYPKGMTRGRGAIKIYFKNSEKPVVIPIIRTKVRTFCEWFWENRMELNFKLYKISDLVEMFAGDHKLSYESRIARELRSLGCVCVPDNVHRIRRMVDSEVTMYPKIYWVPDEKGDAVPKKLRTASSVLREYERERVVFASQKRARALRALSHEEKELKQKLNQKQVQLKNARKQPSGSVQRRPRVA